MSAPEVEAVRQEYEQVLMEVRIELQDSEAERKRLLRKTKALEIELTKRRGKDSRDNGDSAYFDLWLRECKKNPNRTVFGEARQKAVRKARELYSSDEGDDLCRRAIVGVGKFPYVVDGRRCAAGTPDQRFDELELILRNEVNVEKFARLATQEPIAQDQPPTPPRTPVQEPRRREHPRGRGYDPVYELSNALARVGCKIRGNPQVHQHWIAQCPAHDDRDPSLSVTEKGGKVLLYCHAGCPTSAILDALELDWADLFFPDFELAEIIKAVGPDPRPDGKVYDQLGIDWGRS